MADHVHRNAQAARARATPPVSGRLSPSVLRSFSDGELLANIGEGRMATAKAAVFPDKSITRWESWWLCLVAEDWTRVSRRGRGGKPGLRGIYSGQSSGRSWMRQHVLKVFGKSVELILVQTRNRHAAGGGSGCGRRLSYWNGVDGNLHSILFDGHQWNCHGRIE